MEIDRFYKCPICNNTFNDPDAVFCRFCGISAINYCSNEDCNRPCESDAFFCEICGSKTLLGKIEHA